MEKQDSKKSIPIRNLDLEIYRQAKIAALCNRESLGKWVTDAIRERLNKESP